MGDLISRQAAIDALDCINGTEEVLRSLPSAQPECKTGRWEYVDYGGVGNYHCSACGKICICDGDYNFCPNCGSPMEKNL